VRHKKWLLIAQNWLMVFQEDEAQLNHRSLFLGLKPPTREIWGSKMSKNGSNLSLAQDWNQSHADSAEYVTIM
jgi:hypothetical protein